MRAGVVAVAVALSAGIAGVGVLGWMAVRKDPGKTGAPRAAADGAAPSGAATARPRPRGRPAAPVGYRPPVPPPDRGDEPADRDPDAPSPGGAGGGSGASGRPSPGAPAVGDEPPGAQAGARGPAGAGAHAAPISGGAVLPGAGAGSLCPEGMVDTGTFCIDATEVTNAAYAAFLARGPKVAQQPEVCRWNQSFSPVYGAPAGDQKPVIGVDWCDAYAYCAAAGKSLCGHIGGGSNPVSAFADATQSAWYAACTNGGATRYAYGDTFDESLCFHAGDDAALAPVASYPKCVGTKPPYDQIFDMSGNAWEWEDSCAGTTGGADLCRVRGGGTHSTSAPVDCAMDYLAKRDNTSRAVGIRCCAPRAPSR